MRFFILVSFVLILGGCNKPDPNPELKDEIYADLNNQLDLLTHEMEAEEKSLLEHKKVLSEVIPQTGQIKYAQKRIFDSQSRIEKQKQDVHWLKIRIEERLRTTKVNYLVAFQKGELWPNPLEFKQYTAEMKLRRAKREWSVKDRMRAAGVSVVSKESAPEAKNKQTTEKQTAKPQGKTE